MMISRTSPEKNRGSLTWGCLRVGKKGTWHKQIFECIESCCKKNVFSVLGR